MGPGLVTMSTREFDRLEILRRVVERSLTQTKAAELMGLSERQVRRLENAFAERGPSGLVELKSKAIAIVRERYADFEPKLAHEKLVELHHVEVSRETRRTRLSEGLRRFERFRRSTATFKKAASLLLGA